MARDGGKTEEGGRVRSHASERDLCRIARARDPRVLADGRTADAEAQYQAALKLDPKSAYARFRLAVLWEAQGKDAEAQTERCVLADSALGRSS